MDDDKGEGRTSGVPTVFFLCSSINYDKLTHVLFNELKVIYKN